jgi:phage-related protein
MAIASLELDPQFEITQKISYPTIETQLGDGYKQTMRTSLSEIEEYEVSRTGLTTTEIDSIMSSLKAFEGIEGFQWRPNTKEPYKVYICDGWEQTLTAPNMWLLRATFRLDSKGECLAFAAYIDDVEIKDWLSGADSFLTTYTRNTSPLMANSNHLLINSFHEVLGRGGYFPGSSGTSEGQAILIKACCEAYLQTGVVSWLTRAQNMASAFIQYYYNNTTIPSNPNNIWIPHWLLNIKYPFPSKGLSTSADYLNYGYFGITVNFTNGTAVIPSGGGTNGERLSDVYKVYTMSGELLWRNVYAPLISGSEYSIQYWVVNTRMLGQNYRIFPESSASGGTAPVATSEAAGTIKLNTNYTGQAKLVYAAYTTSNVVINQKFEAYPMWRALLSTEFNCAFDTLPWGYEGYKLLNQITGLLSWDQAREATKQNLITQATVVNISNYYVKDNNPDPFIYPGSQYIVVNNSNGATALRQVGGTLNNFLRINVNAAPGGSFPSVEVQNFAIQTGFGNNTQVTVETAHTNSTVMQVILSTNSDAFSQSDLYSADFLVPGSSTLVTKTFNAQDFIKWKDTTVIWHNTIADNPIYTYSGGAGASASTTRASETIGNQQAVIHTTTIDRGSTGFAGMGYVIVDGSNVPLNGGSVRPPKMYLNITGSNVNLRITDASNIVWERSISATTGWQKLQYQWSDFTYATSNGGSSSGITPNLDDFIRKIEFETTGNSTIKTWWITKQDDPPKLPTPVTVFKASLVEKDRNAHTFYCGTFRPIGSLFDTLLYNPGVVPFTVNIINGAVDAWRGIPMTGYQDPAIWREFGLEDRCQQALQFLSDAQDAYYTQSTAKKIGAFAPAFLWAYWDAIDFIQGDLNKFSWRAPDPNARWCGYQYRPLVAVARAWMLKKDDSLAGKITMRFLAFIDNDLLTRNATNPLTDFPPIIAPQANYNEPHSCALILRAALYANISGGSRDITFRLIKRCLEYLRSQYVSTGTMAGSFSAGQPTFVESSVTYREYFGFWHGEIISTLCELLRLKDQIRYPTCQTQL